MDEVDADKTGEIEFKEFLVIMKGRESKSSNEDDLEA